MKLYRKIVESLSIKMQACLHLVLRIMIDAYFDDQKEYNRLIKMIDEKTSMESKYISAAHEATLESLKYTKEDLNITKHELEKTNTKIANYKNKLEKTNKNLIKSNTKIANYKNELKRTTSKIAELEAEIQKLKMNQKTLQ